MLFEIIATILGTLGVFGFFIGNTTLIVLGGMTGVAVNILGLIAGQQRSILIPGIAVIAGVIYSSTVGLSFWMGALIGLSFSTAIAGIIGWFMLAMTKKK